jgi:UDP-N-acetylglucosamine:LPS N-acetylglucosamine transferase
MWASDVVIAKAGPNVIYEAMRCQLPLILTDAIPGQETGNLDFVERHGLGLVATRPEQVAAAARRLLTEPGLADNVKSSMQSICQPDAARQIAKMILDGV